MPSSQQPHSPDSFFRTSVSDRMRTSLSNTCHQLQMTTVGHRSDLVI
jgi:hypothetical protein